MRKGTLATGFLLLACAFAALPARATTDAEMAKQDRIDELERKVDVLTEELSKMREEQGVPEDAASLESYQGLGPALSKIYGMTRGLSLGGYTEGFYRGYVGDDTESNVNRADLLRLVLYTGYKFNEHLVFNSEIEFEHATTSDGPEALGNGKGEVSVEFAALDYLWREEANLRGGLVLVPMGFLNEMHEPTYFNGVSRPEVERRIIPTTWREMGGGLYGQVGESIRYRAFAMTALDAQGLRPDSLRNARSSASRARAEDGAGVLRVDWLPFDGGLLGGSFYYAGGLGQDREGFGNTAMAFWDLHAELNWKGLEVRGLYTQALLDGAGEATRTLLAQNKIKPGQAISNSWIGAYGEVSYDVMPWIRPESGWALVPFFRAEWLDTQADVPSGFEADETLETWVFTPGITLKPHPNVALKFDYRNFAPSKGEQADEVEIGFGLEF